MTSFGYNATIVFFWLVSMSWLVWTKVLPPLVLGTPPTYASIVEATSADPIQWNMFWNGEPVGLAHSEMVENTLDSTTQFWCWVEFRDLPLAELNPLKINFLNKLLERGQPRVSMDAESRVEIDSLGRLLAFESKVEGGPLVEPVQVLGTSEDGKLRLLIRSGDFSYRTEMYLPPDRIMGDAFSPQARLPGLRLGQSWSEPVYNAFSPPTAPMELLQANVEREDFLLWNGQIDRTLLVVYRAESGAKSAAEGDIRGRAWVRRDGLVLQQEARLAGSTLRFVRDAKIPERRLPARQTGMGVNRR